MGDPFDQVLGAARLGDEDAWRAIYRDYAPKILGYLRARRHPDPEDLMGEVLLQVVRDLHSFSGTEDAFRSWIFTITHHRMLDDVRYRSRQPVRAPEDDGDAERFGEVGDVEVEAINSLSEQRIREMLGKLSDDQQTVLLLKLFAGMTASQIAAAMGRSYGAVKALQHRGLAVLRGALEEQSALLEPRGAMQGERA